MNQKQVLVLCTGNSCRSQIAEALINQHLSDRWQAFSAGTQPSGYVHPLALRVLEEIGIRHSGESKSAERFRNHNFDVVITVCDDAAENCPVWLGKGSRVHISLPDPARVEGNEEQKLAAFRQTREDIYTRVLGYLKDFPIN